MIADIAHFLIVHFKVTGGNEGGADHVLIQFFLLYHVNHVVLMVTSRHDFHMKRTEVFIKIRSTSATFTRYSGSNFRPVEQFQRKLCSHGFRAHHTELSNQVEF